MQWNVAYHCVVSAVEVCARIVQNVENMNIVALS